ncbi:hypothetical protein EV175_000179 [Coemansia sp. RSA 1933]|nr:hypothetical protein EV175_000179 [Coemansia sp. RSA 1933]
MRADGIVIVDPANNSIVFADADAIAALRGPAEEWVNGQPTLMRDESCTGTIGDHWRLLESVSISDKSGSGNTHHYLVVERKEDATVCWIQFCLHQMPPEDGRSLCVWNVRDITNSARCLDMLRTSASTGGDYMLSLEDDGFPHSPLLTQVQSAESGVSPAPKDIGSRDSLFQLLETAASTGAFGVLHLTGFGAVDSVFPRSFLGWREEDILDRSFVGLLSPEDRVFFCQALRRCCHDGLPQRLILKVASDFASEAAAGCDKEQQYLDCDVTVLMPDATHHPVLVVKANDLLQQGANSSSAVSVVRRMRPDEAAAHLRIPQPAVGDSAFLRIPQPADDDDDGDDDRLPMRVGTPYVFPSPLSCSLSRSTSSPSFGIVPDISSLSEARRTRSVDISYNDDDDDDDDDDDRDFGNGRFAYMPPTPPKQRVAETPQSEFLQSLCSQHQCFSNMVASTLAPSSGCSNGGALSFSCNSDCSCIYSRGNGPLLFKEPADMVGFVDIAVLSGGDNQDLVEAKTVTTPSELLPNLHSGTKQATRSSSSDSTSTHIDEGAASPNAGKIAFQILCGMTEETTLLASPKGSRTPSKECVSRSSMLSLVSDKELARVSIPMSKIFACTRTMPAMSQAGSVGLCEDLKETAHGSFSVAGESFISVLENMNIGTT